MGLLQPREQKFLSLARTWVYLDEGAREREREGFKNGILNGSNCWMIYPLGRFEPAAASPPLASSDRYSSLKNH